MALTDFLDDTERQLRANGAFGYLGKTIDGRIASFAVTRAGLVAAGHLKERRRQTIISTSCEITASPVPARR